MALPEYEKLREQSLQSLKLPELAIIQHLYSQPLHARKSVNIEKILEMCQVQRSVEVHGPHAYTTMCSQYQSLFGNVIYRALITSVPVATAASGECQSHPISEAGFTPFLKQALESCPPHDLELLGNAVAMKTSAKPGSVMYIVKHASKGIIKSVNMQALLCKVFQYDFLILHSFSPHLLIETFLSENFEHSHRESAADLFTLIFAILEGRGYPVTILYAIRTTYHLYSTNTKSGRTQNDRRFLSRKDARIQRVAEEIYTLESASENWPQPVPESTLKECYTSYRNSIQYIPLSICASCGADDRQRTGSYIPVSSLPPMDNLVVNDHHILEHSDPSRFKYIDKRLDGLLLQPKGIRAVDRACSQVELYLCSSCYAALSKHNMPRLALNNNLYRGELPSYLQDITWVEEMACALYRTTAHVARIYGSSSDTDPLQLRGNTCAHPMNIFSNATTLPWSPTDLNDLITIIFIGPRKLRKEDWAKLTPYFVRKAKIVALLEFLRAHNKLYMNLPPLDMGILDLYPDNDLLPGLEERIIYDHETNPEQSFEEETSGFDEHPAQNVDSDQVFLERSGVYDPESTGVPGRNMTSSALRNIAIATDRESSTLIHYDLDPIPEYNNPDLFPGMFPTLFPFGIGGFEVSSRNPSVSLEMHAKHLLDLADRSFRYHYFYIFVVLNLIQCRKAHLHPSFSVKSSRFHTIAPALLSVHPDVLNNLAHNIRDEFNPALFTPEEKNALLLLKEVNTISSRIPGSQASKIHARHEIRSFFSHFL